MNIANPVTGTKPPPKTEASANPPPIPEAGRGEALSPNDEFVLFRTKEKLWAFPRAHLVSAKLKDKLIGQLDFRTHMVLFAGNNCADVFPNLLDGRVSAVVVGEVPDAPLHVRSVLKLEVTTIDPASEAMRP
jgi:hypothetical protein